jgi:hypothetical protein
MVGVSSRKTNHHYPYPTDTTKSGLSRDVREKVSDNHAVSTFISYFFIYFLVPSNNNQSITHTIKKPKTISTTYVKY